MEQSEYTDQMIIKLIKQILELNSVQFMKHRITKAAVLRLKDFKIIILNSSDMQHQLRCGQAFFFLLPRLLSHAFFHLVTSCSQVKMWATASSQVSLRVEWSFPVFFPPTPVVH